MSELSLACSLLDKQLSQWNGMPFGMFKIARNTPLTRKHCVNFLRRWWKKTLSQQRHIWTNVVKNKNWCKTSSFITHALDTSSICKYWNCFIDNVNCIKALIAVDRTGDWEGNLDAVGNLPPIFRGCDSINYLRYATFYLESMRRLPTDHPAIYEMFMKGYFVINESHRKFSGVSPDMKLEQTIQRAQKSSNGIICQTRWISYVSEWEVVYHEILAISNTFRRPTNFYLGASESELYRELDGDNAKVFNAQVTKSQTFWLLVETRIFQRVNHNCAILSPVYVFQKLPHSN